MSHFNIIKSCKIVFQVLLMITLFSNHLKSFKISLSNKNTNN